VKDEKKYMAWARVIQSHSEDMTADVKLDTGLRLNRASVMSKDWSGSNSSRGFGARDLPPEDALVLVVFPSGTIDDALILCSAYTLLGKHAAKWKADILIASKEREVKRLMENGDEVTYDKDTGAAKLTINNAEVEITATGAVKITPATGQAITLNGGVIGANDFTNCLFNTALHCTNIPNTVKVP